MFRSLIWSVVGPAGAVGLLAGPVVRVLDATQDRLQTVHVSVLAKDGTPVVDMAPDEFEVKEGGRVQKLVRAKLATTPMRIALVVADGGSGAFQLGAAYFIQDLLESQANAAFAIYSVLVQPERYVDYTRDTSLLKGGINRLGRRGTEATSPQLLDALFEVAKEVRGEADRSAVVVMRTGGEGPTNMRADGIRKELVRHGTTLYAVSTAYAQRAAPSQIRGTDAIAVQRGQLADAEIAESAFNLQIALGDGSRETGGRHDQVVANTLVTAMRQIARELKNQYEIVYERPDGAAPSDRLQVTSTRKDTKVQAPSKISTGASGT
jgi:VWFA-related protein